MLKTCPMVHRLVVCFLAILCGMLAFSQPAVAQLAIPDPAPLSNFNPLCDSSLLHCLEIDRRVAGHGYAHFQVLPRTERRDTAAIFPMGVTLGLFGRIAGGLSTSYAFWREGDATLQQLGPLRLNLTGRLLPLFSSDGDSHDAPPARFQLGLAYEQEVRVGPFSGANLLGLLTDLASLHLIGSKWLGPFQLSASIGALFDWKGDFATGAFAGQFGWLIPGFEQLKVFVEGMARGIPAYAKTGALPLIPDVKNPIHPQGIVGGGLAFRAHRRVDLAVAVQRGFGSGLAPWTLGVNFLVLSAGEEHEGRAVTPLAALMVDATRAGVSWVVRKLQDVDPYLKNNCVLYDDNHQPTGKLGELSADGRACIYKGLRVPIGPHFWHNASDTLLCYEKPPKDCFLTRPDRHSEWEPVHPLEVHQDCYAYYAGQPWMRVGQPSADKQSCENQGHVIPVGQELKPDHDHPSYYCYDEPSKAKNQTQKLWCLEKPSAPISDIGYGGRQGIARGRDNLDKLDKKSKQFVEEVASGTPLHATTPAKEAAEAGRNFINAAKDAKVEDAERIYDGVVEGTKRWWNKPRREKIADGVEAGADAATSPGTYLPGGALGRGGKLVEEGIEAAGDAAKAGKRVTKAVKTVGHGEHTLVEAGKAERRAAQAAHAAEEARAAKKAVNIPGWRKIEIDMQHIMERHVPGAPYAAGRTLFPEHMNESMIGRAVRQAYRYGETVGGQGERVMVRGTAAGLRIEMWVNKTTKTIETAYPVF